MKNVFETIGLLLNPLKTKVADEPAAEPQGDLKGCRITESEPGTLMNMVVEEDGIPRIRIVSLSGRRSNLV